MAFLRSVWGPFLVAPVLRRMVEQAGSRVFWAVQGVLVGGLVLLAGLTLQREVAVLKLHTEVGELKGLLVAFSGREIASDEKVFSIIKFGTLQNSKQNSDSCFTHQFNALSSDSTGPKHI